DALAELLAEPLEDPFAAEVVAVPTRGVERWLAQRLSHRLGTSPDGRDGVCARVEFPSLRRLLTAVDAGPGEAYDPWDPDRAVWPLLRVLDASRSEPWAGLVESHLADERRRFGFGAALAVRFAAYGRDRPGMIRAWKAGANVDPAGRPLPEDRAWQPELWRRLRAEINEPSPTERLDSLPRGTAAAGVPTLPVRLSVFGPTRLDDAQITRLDALAAIREVHLWLPHPSPALWDAVAARLAEAPPESRRRVDDPTAEAARHRLLAYLGRDCRELQVRLGTVTAPVTTRHYPADHRRPTTLLQQLQRAVADNAPLPSLSARPVLRADDTSIRVHAAHGPDRQVEVLREALVGLLADDETLEPRDIIVLCPDIETYAPLVSAAFGLDSEAGGTDPARPGTESHPGHRLRVRLADRSLRSLNPLLAGLSRLLDLADSRVQASELLDFCLSAPVARKFGFGEDDAERIPELVRHCGVRWGLDAEHRRAFGLSGFGQNTWAAGLDRMLLGVTMDEAGQHYIGTALPLDDVDSGDVDLVGRLSECVDRVQTALRRLSHRQSVESW
ncbi:MAG: exodeoxyribonuclease V subunit gamma, partial [Actinomycetes bacterium]